MYMYICINNRYSWCGCKLLCFIVYDKAMIDQGSNNDKGPVGNFLSYKQLSI